MTGNDAEIIAAMIAIALLIGGVVKGWMIMWGKIATHEVRLGVTETDVRDTAQILASLVPTVAKLEERTKLM